MQNRMTVFFHQKKLAFYANIDEFPTNLSVRIHRVENRSFCALRLKEMGREDDMRPTKGLLLNER